MSGSGLTGVRLWAFESRPLVSTTNTSIPALICPAPSCAPLGPAPEPLPADLNLSPTSWLRPKPQNPLADLAVPSVAPLASPGAHCTVVWQRQTHALEGCRGSACNLLDYWNHWLAKRSTLNSQPVPLNQNLQTCLNLSRQVHTASTASGRPACTLSRQQSMMTASASVTHAAAW